MALTQVSTGGIKDGTISNADLDASAAIDGSKVSPDFGAQNLTTTGTVTGASLIPSSSTVPTNGVYLPAANSVGISTNGTGRLFVDSSGRIGVASTPDSWGTLRPIQNGEAAFSVNPGNNTAYLTCNGYLASGTGSWTKQLTGASSRFDLSGDNHIFYTAASGSTGSTFSWTERMRLTPTGLGLGSSSPAEQLELAKGSERLMIGADSPAGYSRIAARNTANSGYRGFQIDGSDLLINSNTSGNVIVATGGGRVGVGTTSASGRLTIANDAALNELEFSGSDYTNVYSNTTQGFDIGISNGSSTGPLRFLTANAERFRIANTGAFGLSGANYGSSGQVLTSQGSGAAPQWATPAGGAWTYISTVTASNSASVAFTSGIDSTYDVYVVVAHSIVPATNGTILLMRTSSNGGSSYDSGASDYQTALARISNQSTAISVNQTGAADAVYFDLGGISNDTTLSGVSFTLKLYNLSSSTKRKAFEFDSTIPTSSTDFRRAFGGATRNSTSAINAIQFYFGLGNINTGTFRLYGIKNS